jgi:hypothetical protein
MEVKITQTWVAAVVVDEGGGDSMRVNMRQIIKLCKNLPNGIYLSTLFAFLHVNFNNALAIAARSAFLLN